MIGLDHRSVTEEEAVELARQVHDAACSRVADGLHQLLDHHQASALIVAGHGIDLLPDLPDTTRLALVDVLETDGAGPDVARCAPSYAVTRLALDHWNRSPCVA